MFSHRSLQYASNKAVCLELDHVESSQFQANCRRDWERPVAPPQVAGGMGVNVNGAGREPCLLMATSDSAYFASQPLMSVCHGYL